MVKAGGGWGSASHSVGLGSTGGDRVTIFVCVLWALFLFYTIK